MAIGFEDDTIQYFKRPRPNNYPAILWKLSRIIGLIGRACLTIVAAAEVTFSFFGLRRSKASSATGLANLAPKGGFIAAEAQGGTRAERVGDGRSVGSMWEGTTCHCGLDGRPRVGGGELAFVGVHADVRDYHERAAKPKNAEIVATVPK